MSKVIELNRTCHICGANHFPSPRCDYQTLAKRILQLVEANRMIPALMEAQNQAVDAARQFQAIIKQTDKAFDILQEVLSNHGELGNKIWGEYLERMDVWQASVTSKPDTNQLKPDTENLISSGADAKNSIEEKTGGPLQLDS